jgi:tRNA threonylcarbamoyladenosine biosynthesis protein TsaB
VIVALESASTDLSVALVDERSALDAADGWSSAQRQSAEMLPRLLALCEREGRSLDDASAVAVGIGPGSFTGLRVGMSLAKGLALALDIPIVGIRSLEAWLAADPDAAAALARAGAREAYLLLRGEEEPRIVDRGALPDRIGTARVAAPGELADAFELAGAVAPYGAARSVARMAAERLAADPAGDDLAHLEPAYLRAPRGVPVGER